jgi:hypothetical protein
MALLKHSCGLHQDCGLLVCLNILQGVIKRCRLSLLTNSDIVYEPKCGWMGGGGGGAESQPMNTAVHIT